MKFKVVIIDQNKRANKLITELLRNDFEVYSVNSLSDGGLAVSQHNPNIVILDPLFPKPEGIKFIKELREWSECQIVAVSENGSELAVVKVMDSGADDYIRKPFFSDEFKSRINACVRRIKALDSAKGINAGPYYKVGGLIVDYDSRRVLLDGKDIHLTKNEFEILALLCRHSGKVLTYDYILKSVWGPRVSSGTGILRVNITNLRKKIQPETSSTQYLFTQNGIGYRISKNEITI